MATISWTINTTTLGAILFAIYQLDNSDLLINANTQGKISIRMFQRNQLLYTVIKAELWF